MKTIKSLGTFIKETTRTPNLTHALRIIWEIEETKPSRYKDADSIWSLLLSQSYTPDYLYKLARDLVKAEDMFECQNFDPTTDFL